MSDFIPIYVVDFDGTLCESKWPGIGAPNIKLINHLIKRRKEGSKVILWTCRVGKRLDEAVEWCKNYGLEFDAVNDNLPEMIERHGNNCRKVFASCYIDDMAVNKERYDIPFHQKKECNFNDKETRERYKIDSIWTLSAGDQKIPVKVVMYKKCNDSSDIMEVKSISSEHEWKHYSCRREVSWFADKLFPKEEGNG